MLFRSLAGPDAATGEATGALAGALQALTEVRAGRGGGADDRTAPREAKTIQEAYRETYPTLLRYCNVTVPESVAPLWNRLANATKGEYHNIITQEFQRVCMARGLSTDIYVPVVTAGLKQMITGFQFVGNGIDDLRSGCQPFQVSYAGSANHYRALAEANVSNQLAQGDQAASLADYRTIRDQEKIKFPRDTMEVCITLTRYCVLCQTLFQGTGPSNPFVDYMWTIASTLQNATPFITERYAQAARVSSIAHTYFACIVRAVQVSVHDYLHGVSTNLADGHAGIDLPELRDLTSALKRGTFPQSNYWVPIPEEYLDPPTLGHYPSTASATSVPGTSHTTGGSTSGRTTLSTLTADTTRGPPVARVDNPAPDAEFTAITVQPGGTRRLLREHPPQSNAAGHEFCVAWWLRGGCFPNCGRRATHVPFANAAERTRLLTYCRERLAVPASAST